MTLEKSRTRIARRDILRRNTANARHNDRQKAKGYDHKAYDDNASEES